MTKLSRTAREILAAAMKDAEVKIKDAQSRRGSLQAQLDLCIAQIEKLEEEYETLRKDLI